MSMFIIIRTRKKTFTTTKGRKRKIPTEKRIGKGGKLEQKEKKIKRESKGKKIRMKGRKAKKRRRNWEQQRTPGL